MPSSPVFEAGSARHYGVGQWGVIGELARATMVVADTAISISGVATAGVWWSEQGVLAIVVHAMPAEFAEGAEDRG